MTKTILFCTYLFGLLCLAETATGQPQEFFHFRKYSQNEGLSSYNITKILKDKYGFIWIATQDGLNRFDGIRFLVFNKDVLPARRINGNNIMGMDEDRIHNCIWLVTPYGGVERINTTTQAVFPLMGADAVNLRLKDKWLLHAITVVENILWIGTYEGLLAYDLGKHSFLRLTNLSLSPVAMRVNKIMRDEQGRIWACCDGQGVFVFDGHNGKALFSAQAGSLDLFHERKPLLFWNIASSGDKRVALATSWGLRLLNIVTTSNGDSLRLEDSTLFHDDCFSASFDARGNTWFSDAHGLYKLPPSQHQAIKILENTNTNESWQSSIYALFADDSRNIWVGSEEGLAYFRPEDHAFSKFYTSYTNNVKIQHCFSICPAGNGIVWCGAANGLYRVNTQNHEIQKINDGTSCHLIDHISDDELLISNSNGCSILEHDKLQPAGEVYPELSLLRGDLLCCFKRFNDSIILLASELHRGLYVWNLRSHRIKVFNSANSSLLLDEGIINSLFKDRLGQVWVLSDKSLSRFDPFTGASSSYHIRIPGETTTVQLLFDICEIKDSYWIAAYGTGLIELDKQMQIKRMVSQQYGLSNNGLYRILSVGDSLVVATSNKGLSVLNTHTGAIKRYYDVDGLQSNSFEQLCAYQYKDVLYAGGVNGITVIHPRYFAHNTRPPEIYYTGVSMKDNAGVADTTDLGLHSLEIKSSVYQTTISFAGLNFSDPQRTTYAYRIKELSPAWTSLYAQNFINLIGINPGKYTLETRAANEDGVWSAQPAQLLLVFLPKWYQTILFKILVILLLAGLFYALYRYRIAQYRKQQQIRREIANDLHDDLGSTLTTVKMLTQVARRSAEKEIHFDQIEHSITTASSGLRDMIWVLDDAKDSLRDFIDRLGTILLPVATAKNIHLDFKIEPELDDWRLTKAEKRNLLMVIKEAVNNSVKYSDCRNIRMHACLESKKVSLSINDDGKGFDPAAVSDGNGLKNIRYRARQIHYSVRIASQPGVGTEIHLLKE